MAMFDPKKAREQGGNKGIPAGDYLIAIKSSKLQTSKAGNDYRRCTYVVIAGAAKKRTFFDNVFWHTEGAQFRLAIMAEQVGCEESFDPTDDASFARHFHGRPFKARLSRKANGEYVDNGIDRVLTGKDVTDAERQTMQEWVVEQADAAEWSGGDDRDVPPPGDDDLDRPTAGYGRADDDIPF